MWPFKEKPEGSHQRLMEKLYPLVRGFMGILEGYDGENKARVNEFKEQLNELTITQGIENQGIVIAELDDTVFDEKLPLVKAFIEVTWEIYISDMEYVDKDFLRVMYYGNLGADVPKCLTLVILLRRMIMTDHYRCNIMGTVVYSGTPMR